MAGHKFTLDSSRWGLTDDELFEKVEKLVPDEKRTEALITSHSVVIPRNHQVALDDLCREIERPDHPKKLHNFKSVWLYPKGDQADDDLHDQIYLLARNAYFQMMLRGQGVNLPLISEMHQRVRQITRIDYIQNKKLEEEFEEHRKAFKKLNIPTNELEFFHGTSPCQIDSILSKNFDLSAKPHKRQKLNFYGKGIYFSQYPAIAKAYGKLILCRVLPGRVEEMSKQKANMTPKIGDGFDSRRVDGMTLTNSNDDTMGNSVIHVIKNPSQILPYCVIHLAELQPEAKPRAPLPTPPTPPMLTSSPYSPLTSSTTTSSTSSPMSTPPSSPKPKSKKKGAKAASRPSILVSVPSILASVPSTSASVPSTSASVPSTSASVPSTSASVPSTSASVPSTSTASPPAKRKKKSIVTGTQPKGGTMKCKRHNTDSLPGYPNTSTIKIKYDFPPGFQGPEHPNPGQPYKLYHFPRSAYLPDTDEGSDVLALLQEAFERRLIFTVGKSATTGEDNSVIWAGIPHKTSKVGGGAYGYPDPEYFKTVLEKLKEKGVDAGQL